MPKVTWVRVYPLGADGVHGEERALPVLHDVHDAALAPLLLGELGGGDSIAIKNRLKIGLKNLMEVPFPRDYMSKHVKLSYLSTTQDDLQADFLSFE